MDHAYITGVVLSPGARGAPLWGVLTGHVAFLELPGVSGLQPCAQAYLKKALCHTCPAGGTVDKYRVPSHDTLRSAVFGHTQIWSGVFWFGW